MMKSALIAAALLLSINPSFAADKKPEAAGTAAEAAQKPAAAGKQGEKKAAPAAKVKLVDINSATKAELKKLPGISDADAAKIIAGRPYLSKANLTTRDIITREAYENLKTQVIARQK
jgi:DNA uptake protein ComE-like DNA-binding protein